MRSRLEWAATRADPVFKYVLPALLAAAGGGCPIDNGNENDQTFTVTSDVALSGTFETVEQGNSAAYESYPKGAYFFSTASEFESFYSTLRSNVSPPPTPPTVDFVQYRVVAGVDTEQPSPAYGAAITSVELDSGDQYNVTAHFSRADGVWTAVLSKPYHIVKVQVQ